MEAERASAAKDRFLATLSHELRTPLTPVLAMLSTWEVSADLPETMRRDVQMLRRNIELEARLIDDLLDVTRIMKGKLSLNKEATDVNDMLTSVAGIVQLDMQAKHIHFTLQLNAQRHFVNGDPARLQQIVWDLLKNAAKFTPERGSITLATANDADGSITLTITDTGIGISPNFITRIFQPFEQGSEPFVQRLGGLGLGLTIAKALVDAHGGSISVSSEGCGKGATFVVRLPTIDAPSKTETTAPSPLHIAGRPLSILLVEDHVDTATVMGRLLTNLGHYVQIAGTVASALNLAQQHTFDLLLCDIGLPDGNGIDLLGKLQAIRPIPAVALTGYGMEEDIAKCRAAGFRAHLTKPVNFRKLQDVLAQTADDLTGG
jgi:CheY-like chemotaxis protein/anti-sigma regulatory factor (Ser/Thr protein kinase)